MTGTAERVIILDQVIKKSFFKPQLCVEHYFSVVGTLKRKRRPDAYSHHRTFISRGAGRLKHCRYKVGWGISAAAAGQASSGAWTARRPT